MDVKLTVETGRPTGTRPARRMRREGVVPGVVYGLGSAPRSVSVPWPELRRALSTEAGQNALLALDVDGRSHLAMVKELQRHRVRRSVEHVDFVLIDPETPLGVDVPITLHGTAEAVEAHKGIVDQIMYTLPVKAKPGDIPNELQGDISHLEIGSALRAGEIALPGGVELDVGEDEPVAQGSATRSTVMMQQADARAERIAAGEATEEDLAIESGELDAEDVADAAAGGDGDDGGE